MYNFIYLGPFKRGIEEDNEKKSILKKFDNYKIINLILIKKRIIWNQLQIVEEKHIILTVFLIRL